MLRSKASRWAAAPYLVWMVLFIVVPLGIVVWYALTNSDGQVTLANLTSIGRYASVFGRSLLGFQSFDTVLQSRNLIP